MKSIKTSLLAIAALAAVLAVASCKNNDDDPSEIASYSSSSAGAKITFFDDNSFVGTDKAEASLEGTYSGSLDTNGTVKLTVTKMSSPEGDVPKAMIPELLTEFGGNGSSAELQATVSDSGKKLALKTGLELTRD